MTRRAAIYARVSTGEQTPENQLRVAHYAKVGTIEREATHCGHSPWTRTA
jgi:hypothetical protein